MLVIIGCRHASKGIVSEKNTIVLKKKEEGGGISNKYIGRKINHKCHTNVYKSQEEGWRFL